jgi:Protein of unknown function (DUF3515)
MAAQPARSAALLSALVAIPVALIAGAVVFVTLHAHVTGAHAAAPATSATAMPRVAMAAPILSAADAQACLAFIAALPVTLRNLNERSVTAGAQQNIAYGDPAITAACGAPKATVTPGDQMWLVNSVCWHEVDTTGATVLTTVDRTVPVAVTVPKTYGQALQWLSTFASSLTETVPALTNLPAGECSGS